MAPVNEAVRGTLSAALSDMAKVRSEVDQLSERLIALADALERTVTVPAPAAASPKRAGLDDTYTLDAVAAALSVDRHTVWDWIVANADEANNQLSHIVVGGVTVPAIRCGRSWRIAAAPLDRVLSGEVVA